MKESIDMIHDIFESLNNIVLGFEFTCLYVVMLSTRQSSELDEKLLLMLKFITNGLACRLACP